MDWAYVLPHRPDDCGVAMDSKFFPPSPPQDAKSGQLGRSIPQPRQTLNIGAALAQGSASRAAFGGALRSSGPGSARVYGLDELDVPYCQSTEHLLPEPSHSAAVQVLDRFIQAHGERLIQDPFKRCLLQRDLWQLFDWA